MPCSAKTQQQIDAAIRLRAIGCTFEMIAWKLNVTKDRARTLVGKALRQRRLESERHPCQS